MQQLEACIGLGLAGLGPCNTRPRGVGCKVAGTPRGWGCNATGNPRIWVGTDQVQELRRIHRPIRFLSRHLISIKS